MLSPIIDIAATASAHRHASLQLPTPVPGPSTAAHSPPHTRPLQASSTAAYAKDLRLFITWGGQVPTNVETLHKYIRASCRKAAPSTVYRRAMAIRHAHVEQGLPSPTEDASIRPILRGLQLGYQPGKAPSIERPEGTGRRKEPRTAKPITRALLSRTLDAMHRNSLDRRDRALLTLAFVGALKRGELVALNLSDLRFTPDALMVKVKSREIAVPRTGGELCAATAVQQWIEHAALDMEQPAGPVFRSFDRGGNPTLARLDSAWVSVVLKNRLKAVGIDSAPFSAQSLRRGRLMESAKGVL